MPPDLYFTCCLQVYRLLPREPPDLAARTQADLLDEAETLVYAGPLIERDLSRRQQKVLLDHQSQILFVVRHRLSGARYPWYTDSRPWVRPLIRWFDLV